MRYALIFQDIFCSSSTCLNIINQLFAFIFVGWKHINMMMYSQSEHSSYAYSWGCIVEPKEKDFEVLLETCSNIVDFFGFNYNYPSC